MMPDLDNPIGIGIRKGPEQYRVQDRENGHRGADAERERERSDSCVRRTPGEHTCGVFQFVECIQQHRLDSLAHTAPESMQLNEVLLGSAHALGALQAAELTEDTSRVMPIPQTGTPRTGLFDACVKQLDEVAFDLLEPL
jgi:hypothetical protein